MGDNIEIRGIFLIACRKIEKHYKKYFVTVEAIQDLYIIMYNNNVEHL